MAKRKRKRKTNLTAKDLQEAVSAFDTFLEIFTLKSSHEVDLDRDKPFQVTILFDKGHWSFSLRAGTGSVETEGQSLTEKQTTCIVMALMAEMLRNLIRTDIGRELFPLPPGMTSTGRTDPNGHHEP
ncbi:hypothetical protein ACFL2Q_02835 [Thermodesulfobacteriota bacterium]